MFYFTRISERQKKFYNADADADVNANNADAEMSMPKFPNGRFRRKKKFIFVNRVIESYSMPIKAK